MVQASRKDQSEAVQKSSPKISANLHGKRNFEGKDRSQKKLDVPALQKICQNLRKKEELEKEFSPFHMEKEWADRSNK